MELKIFRLQTIDKCPPHFQVMQLSKISLGCPILNRFLQGGFPLQGVNEIAGESGSGKTQIGMQMAVASVEQLHSNNDICKHSGAVVYICTEDRFPIKRLHQIISCRPKADSGSSKKADNYDVMDKIFLEHINDVDALFSVLQTKVPMLIERHGVKTVIIDSVAAVFRCEPNDMGSRTGAGNYEKSRKLGSLGSLLHRLNRAHTTAIICINQVTDVIPSNRTDQAAASEKFHKVQPSLGLLWSNFITTRVMLSRIRCESSDRLASEIMVDKDKPSTSNTLSVHGGQAGDQIVRQMEILLSPLMPRSKQHFLVNSSGVHGLEDDQ